MGAGDFIDSSKPFSAPYSQSSYIPDHIINPHPRFAALATNIRSRRGAKVDIQVPLFRDTNTPEYQCKNSDCPAVDNSKSSNISDDTTTDSSVSSDLPPGYKIEVDNNIHMDAMGFGMEMCCLVSKQNEALNYI